MRPRRRTRATVRALKNRHLAAYALLQQGGLLADAMLLEGTPASVRAVLSCLREATAVLEELLCKGGARAGDGTVPDLTRHRRRLAVLEALGGRSPESPPPRRAA